MWNDTDTPIAYLITFRTHGTWLHGDERGSISRHHNTYGTPKLPYTPAWLETNRERLIDRPFILNARQRVLVRRSMRETCQIREWRLLAVNIRTNHAHAVVAAPSQAPGTVLNALKANATRSLRENQQWLSERSPWPTKAAPDICGLNYMLFARAATSNLNRVATYRRLSDII